LNDKPLSPSKEAPIVNPVKVLILTANPTDTDRLQLNREVSKIKDALERSTYRDRFQVIERGAVTVHDLANTIIKHNPDIVHFSGHGAGEQGLAFEDDKGQLKLVPTDALVETFRLANTRKTVKCVFLNACYSEIQADAIYQQIDCVVGMNQPIGDKTAIQFSPHFYAALAEGRSFQDAFDYAKNFLRLDSNKEAATPMQKIRQGAANLFSEFQPIAEPTSVASLSSQPTRHSTMSIGNISINGDGNPVSVIEGNGNTVSQNINRVATSSSDLQAAIAALADLKRAIANTDALGSYEKSNAEGTVAFIEKEIQKSPPDKSGVKRAIAALKQALESVVTLAEPVTKVAELLAKAWMV
jgi:hypothetical protein